MEDRILEIIYDEKEELWRDLNDCIRCKLSENMIKVARARWSTADRLYKKIKREVTEND